MCEHLFDASHTSERDPILSEVEGIYERGRNLGKNYFLFLKIL